MGILFKDLHEYKSKMDKRIGSETTEWPIEPRNRYYCPFFTQPGPLEMKLNTMARLAPIKLDVV